MPRNDERDCSSLYFYYCSCGEHRAQRAIGSHKGADARIFHQDAQTDLLADDVVYELEKHKAKAEGNVRFTSKKPHEETVLTCSRVEADLNEDNKITALTASEKVVIIRNASGKTVHLQADQCTYTPETQKAVCTGNVALVQEGSQIQGDRLDANLKTGVYKMASAKQKQIRMELAPVKKPG